MTASHPFTDDPRLSAYALGELSAVEAAAFAKEIANCLEAHAEIAEIRACVQSLTKALAAEPVPAYRPIETPTKLVVAAPAKPRRRMAWVYAAAVSSLALVMGLLVYPGVRQREQPEVTYRSVRNDIASYDFDDVEQNKFGNVAAGDEFSTQLSRTQAHLSVQNGTAFSMEQDSLPPHTMPGLTLAEKQRILEERAREGRVREFSKSLSEIEPKMISSIDVGTHEGTGISINGTNGGSIDLSNRNGTTPEYGGSNGASLASSNEDDGDGFRPTQTKPRQQIVNEYLDGEKIAGAMAGRGRPLNRRPMGGSGGPTAGRRADSHDPRFAPRSSTQSFEHGEKEIFNGSVTQREENQGLESRIVVREAEAVSRVVVPGGRANPHNEAYAPLVENAFLSPAKQPLSTFGLDVDTASYANVRRFLQNNQLPPKDAVRIEELVNYFAYADPQPEEHPLNVTVAHASCPWNPQHKLVRIGLKGKEIVKAERPISNLVFLVDVSGSMQDANKLPLVQVALQMLAEELGEKDHISIVTYSSEAKLLLPPTSGHERSDIQSAISRLNASGSTNGAAGLQLAYDTAKQNLLKDGANRVILCTDGDFNVGITDDDQLVTFIRDQASAGTFLSIFGFGMGNLKDAKLEKLANRGNGHYGYIDSTHEARKVFVEELTSTLYTIAKDVKLQVEFNPSRVAEYRLIGYENRLMPAQDFNDDTKDSGDLGAGHSVVAMYEIVPVGVTRQPPAVDDLKYQSVPKVESPATKSDDVPVNFSNEWLTVKVRYQTPTTDENVKPQSVKLEFPLKDEQSVESLSDAQQADFLWSAAVTMYGLLLRDSNYRGTANYDAVLEMANAAKRDDSMGRKAEFFELVNRAKSLAK